MGPIIPNVIQPVKLPAFSLHINVMKREFECVLGAFGFNFTGDDPGLKSTWSPICRQVIGTCIPSASALDGLISPARVHEMTSIAFTEES